MKIFHINTFVFIDEEDLKLYIKYPWRIHKKESETTGYLVYKNLSFHRLITNAPPDKQVDHIDGNGLNNQKTNLRFVSNRINSCNNHKRRKGKTSSKYIGVTKASRSSWRARYYSTSTGFISIGCYKSEKEAAIAYNEYVKNFVTNYDGMFNEIN